MANHALPTTSSLYTDVLANLKDRIDDSLKMLDSVNTSPTSVPTNAVRWNSTTKLWEKYNGSAWDSLAASYAIQVLKSSNLVGGNSTTLLGSIPYQSNTDTTTLLAPNTTTTRKFLRQTGSGTNGSAPVWDTILASDVPTLNQSTTGNAATATKLATARTIGGVSFDGTANIDLPGVNTTGNQNTTGNAATATTATYLSATQQSNAILGANKPTSMALSDSTNNGSFVCRATGTGDGNLAGMTFWNDTYAIKLGVRNDGAFGLGGWSRSAWSWYSDSAGNMTASGNVTAYSDPRLKENFVNIENPIELVKKLNGGTFNWKHGFIHTEVKAGKKDYGILANEVEAIMPEIVTYSIDIEGEKYKTVCYEKIVPLLIEAIKEQQKQIDELKALAKGA